MTSKAVPPCPTKLELAGEDRVRISWSDSRVREYTFGELREHCPCATCRGKRSNPSAAPPALYVAEAQPVRVEAMKPVYDKHVQSPRMRELVARIKAVKEPNSPARPQ